MAFQPGVRVEGMDAALSILQRYMPPEMQKASKRATMAGARVAARLIRAAAPVGKTKKLRGSVRARKGRYGYAAAIAGPTAPHRHLVIRGHRIVGHFDGEGRATTSYRRAGLIASGRRTRANPFVDRAVDAGRTLIVEAMTRELFRK